SSTLAPPSPLPTRFPYTTLFRSLRAGTYSLWTIPRQDTWTIIFNSEHGQWGINSKGEPNRDASRDVLTVDVPSMRQDRVFEQFRSEEHTSELQSRENLVCRLLLE